MLTYRETNEHAERIHHEDRPMSRGGNIGLVDYMGGDRSIAAAATLYQGPSIAGVSSIDDLLVSLAHNRIWKPFRFAELKLRFEMDLAGAHHLVYQPDASINQFSGRYSEFKEGSSDLRALGADEPLEFAHKSASDKLLGLYRSLLEESLAKETARGITLDTTNTSFFLKANLSQIFSIIEDLDRTSWKHNRERAMLAGELRGIAGAVAPKALEAYEASRAGESKDLIDWERAAENAPRAVMAKPRYPTLEKSDTNRGVIGKLEEMLTRSFEPIRGGLVRVTDYMGDYRAIANAARISYKSGKRISQDEALIRTLLQNKHTTPFEMTELSFDVRMPLYIQRQSGRHRTIDQAGFLGETPLADERYMPEDEDLAPQSKTNHQGRGGAFERGRVDRIKELLEDSNEAIPDTDRLDPGLRDRLRPVDSWTRHSVKGDTHNLLHYYGLRADQHAQLEIARYGAVFGEAMRSHTPVVMDAFERFEQNAIRFDRDEISAIRAAGGVRSDSEDIVECAVERGVFGTKDTARRRAKISEFKKRLELLEW